MGEFDAITPAEDFASSSSSWKLGIMFGFMTSCISAMSKLAIRKSWLMVEQAERRNSKNKLLQPSSSSSSPSVDPKLLLASRTMRWGGILGMSVLQPVFDLLAFCHANPSLLAPFSGLTLAFIILLSKQLIGEPPQRIQVCASSLIGVGLILSMLFGDHTNNEDITTLEDVLASYADPVFGIYVMALLLWMGFLWYCINVSKNTLVQRFAWGVGGGSMTGVQCFIKDAMVVLTISNDKRPWKLPLAFYILLGLGVAVAATGLGIATHCMKRYDVTYSNAMNAGALVVSASIMGAVHHKTFSNLDSGLRAVFYLIGLSIILVGLCILVRYTRDHSTKEYDDLDNDDSTSAGSTDSDSSMELGLVEIEETSDEEESVALVDRNITCSSLIGDEEGGALFQP